MTTCLKCGGTGVAPGHQILPCMECAGSGMVGVMPKPKKEVPLTEIPSAEESTQIANQFYRKEYREEIDVLVRDIKNERGVGNYRITTNWRLSDEAISDLRSKGYSVNVLGSGFYEVSWYNKPES